MNHSRHGVGFACATLGGLGDEHSKWGMGEAPPMDGWAILSGSFPDPGTVPPGQPLPPASTR
jgi:hypothetical protein